VHQLRRDLLGSPHEGVVVGSRSQSGHTSIERPSYWPDASCTGAISANLHPPRRSTTAGLPRSDRSVTEVSLPSASQLSVAVLAPGQASAAHVPEPGPRRVSQLLWWALRDSNPRPQPCEGVPRVLLDLRQCGDRTADQDIRCPGMTDPNRIWPSSRVRFVSDRTLARPSSVRPRSPGRCDAFLFATRGGTCVDSER